jgi:hypothetical protein
MSWSTITTAQFLLRGFNSDERTKLQTAAGGDDGLADILTAAIAEWRGILEAAGYAMDATTTTVPPSCHRHIIAQCRWELLVKFPALRQLQTEERKAAADVAEAKLKTINDGTASIESPESPAADVTPGPRFGTVSRDYEYDDEDGI